MTILFTRRDTNDDLGLAVPSASERTATVHQNPLAEDRRVAMKPAVPILPAQAEAEFNVLYQLWAKQNFATNGKLQGRKVELEPASTGLTRVRDLYGNSLLLLSETRSQNWKPF